MAATITADMIYFCIGISIIMFITGIYMKDAALGALSGFIITFVGLHIVINGFDTISNLLTATVGFILSFIGGYIFLRILFEQMVTEVNEFGG